VKTLSRVLTGLSAIRLSNLPGIQSKKKYLEDFAELYNTPKDSSARLYILPCILYQRKDIAMLYKNVVQVELFFLNGSCSICISNPFGVTLKTQSEYRFNVPYPLTALLLSPKMILHHNREYVRGTPHLARFSY
jgi:hypothetical protein